MESGNPVMSLRSVSKWYGSVVAVNDVTLDVHPGVTGLLGPNGAGKTTVLHMMAGLAGPSDGEIELLGQPVRDNPEVYRKLGMMSEHEAVYPFYSGRSFVELGARLHGLGDVGSAVDRAIEYVGLADVQGRSLGTYSRGMRQRMRLAASLVHDPEVLLLDEPLNGTGSAAANRVSRPDEAAGIGGQDDNHLIPHPGGSGNSSRPSPTNGERQAGGVGRLPGHSRKAGRATVQDTDPLRTASSDGFGADALGVGGVGRVGRRRTPGAEPQRGGAAKGGAGDCQRVGTATHTGRADGRIVRERVQLRGGGVSVGPVFLLSLRQLSGKWRLGIILLLAAVPILISVAVVSLAPGGDADGGGGISRAEADDWTTALLGVLIVAAILPIVTMALATACFGNDLEDRTLGYIVLNPVPRWKIVLSKMLAPVAIAGPALILSGVAVAFVGLGGDVKTAGAVAVGLLAGIVAYSAIFVWAGLMTSHAIGFALLYVFRVGRACSARCSKASGT